MANNKIFESDAVIGRISLRKDNIAQWSNYQTKTLRNGEVGFVDGGGEMIPRMMVGDNASTVRDILGTKTLEDLSKITEPSQRVSDYGAVYYSGVGAGYKLPVASATQLGGIKVDNNITTIEGEQLTIKGLVKKYEEGKGYVLHFTDYNVEIDNTLYTHVDKNTQHYERLGLFVNLNKDITQGIKDLQGKKFYFYEVPNERDMLETNTITFGFTYTYLDEEEKTQTATCKNFTVANQQIKFDDLVVFDGGKWLDDTFRTITFTTDALYHDEQKNFDNITFILRFGYPETYDDNGTPEPLDNLTRKYGGMIVNNYKKEGTKDYCALIGIDKDGYPRYSNDFNESTNNGTANYLLYTSKEDISNSSSHKNKIVAYNKNGVIVAKDIEVGSGNKDLSITKTDDKITISHNDYKNLTPQSGKYVSGIEATNGHITNCYYEVLPSTPSTTDFEALRTRVGTLEANLAALQKNYDDLLERVKALEEQLNPKTDDDKEEE